MVRRHFKMQNCRARDPTTPALVVLPTSCSTEPKLTLNSRPIASARAEPDHHPHHSHAACLLQLLIDARVLRPKATYSKLTATLIGDSLLDECSGTKK